MNVVENLADEVWIGDIGNHAKLAAAMRAEADVDLKNALQSLGPGQRRGEGIVAVAV